MRRSYTFVRLLQGNEYEHHLKKKGTYNGVGCIFNSYSKPEQKYSKKFEVLDVEISSFLGIHME
jgi:hypothetical protein